MRYQRFRATRVLFVGEEPLPATASETLGRLLLERGMLVTYGYDRQTDSLKQWLPLAMNCDAIIVVAFDGPTYSLVERLALAATFGRRIVRWWVGSDVLTCLQDGRGRERARKLDKFVSKNVAVSPHLVTELESIGINAVVVPSIVEPRLIPGNSWEGALPNRILAYLPADRPEFYGESVVRQTIIANPDFEFVIVGDTEHRLARLPNVQSLGWTDMNAVYPKIGCLLRITKHDGMPRMVLEALLWGRHVIYSWPFPGCWHASTFTDVQECITRLRNQSTSNLEGAKIAREIVNSDPVAVFMDIVTRLRARGDVRKRLSAACTAIAFAMRITKERFASYMLRCSLKEESSHRH